MKKIRFLKEVEVEARVDICCFSGTCSYQKMHFKPGDELEVSSISYGPKIKTKTRPGNPGGRKQLCAINLKNENSTTTHPDYFVVESSYFEELSVEEIEELMEKMEQYELKLYCVALGYPSGPMRHQSYNLFIWACSEDDAWAVTKEHMGAGIEQMKDHARIIKIEPERGVMCREANGRRPMTEDEMVMEADAWETGKKKPTDPGIITVDPYTGEPI